MKEISKICFIVLGIASVFLLYKIQNSCSNTLPHIDESNTQSVNPKLNIPLRNFTVDRDKFNDIMTCLADEFYFTERAYKVFIQIWNHYSAVIEVSINHLSSITHLGY